MSVEVWLALGVGAFVLLIFAAAILVPRTPRPSRTTDGKIEDVRRRLDDVERRQKETDHDVRAVRMVVNHLATKDSVTNVGLQVAEMRGEVKGLVINTQATTRSVERIEDFLMRSTAEVIAGGTAKGNEAGS
ncbi:hypothetical protein [Methylobacterium iners]|uniref:Uncharacterized protein n=1 Tax=Methylobacterium iners TaxID=418707 RepID=A0ABQ4RTR8_9HYPH|nr:hypothetical protein [Methylobacterium iners]GJD93377.1 hypothetical protein OCOJLMKI_0571 [Methylobacterium iners]